MEKERREKERRKGEGEKGRSVGLIYAVRKHQINPTRAGREPNPGNLLVDDDRFGDGAFLDRRMD